MSTDQLDSDTDLRQIGPVPVRCDRRHLEAGSQREACAVAKGKALTFRARAEICGLDAVLFGESLDSKAAIGTIDRMPDSGHCRSDVLSTLG